MNPDLAQMIGDAIRAHYVGTVHIPYPVRLEAAELAVVFVEAWVAEQAGDQAWNGWAEQAQDVQPTLRGAGYPLIGGQPVCPQGSE